MGLGLPREIITETDLSYYVNTMLKGISCVIGITEKGPIGTPQLISSEMQYERIFGDELRTSDFPMLVKRALSYGAVLWVSRAVHYEDITRKNTLTAKSASVNLPNNAETPTFVLKIKASSPGIWGNNLQVKITENSIDPVTLFNVSVIEGGTEVERLEDMSLSESSEKYIENSGSKYLEIEITGLGIPKAGTYALTGGDITDADYIGSASNTTGMHVFDDITDALQLAVPGVSSPAVITAGIAYCENRGDLLFVTETPFDLTSQEAVDFRLGNGAYTHATFVSSYGALYYLKLKIYDAARQKERYISPIGDVLGVMAINDYTANEELCTCGNSTGACVECSRC